MKRYTFLFAVLMFLVVLPAGSVLADTDEVTVERKMTFRMSFLDPPLSMDAENIAREIVAYAIRPTENFQLYVYRPGNNRVGDMERSVTWIHYDVQLDSSKTMHAGMKAILNLMQKRGINQWKAGLFYFKRTMLDGFAMDLMLRSGMIQESAGELLRQSGDYKDVWYPDAAFMYWCQIRDFIRVSCDLQPGYDQPTRVFAAAVKISDSK